MYTFLNNSKSDFDEKLLSSFMSFAHKNLKFNKSVDIVLVDDKENAKNILGKTAFYSPDQNTIVVYATNRHPKDILRSIAHEVIHHLQNCRGDFDKLNDVGEGYAQKNPHLREMEKEAYESGNLVFRDWEDDYKSQTIEKLYETWRSYMKEK